MAVVPLLAAAGWVALPEMPFHAGRAVAGGLIFGLAMAPAGGCGAGVWQHVGEGRLASLAAVAGFTVAIGAIVHFAAAGTGGVATPPPATPQVAGLPLWAIALPLAIGLLLLATRLAPTAAAKGAWTWQPTGLAIGVVGVAAWALAGIDGRGYGLAIIPGNIAWFEALLRFDPGRLDGAAALVVAVTVGAHVAARIDGQFKWSAAAPRQLATAFAGGIGLGVGGALAAGCTVGLGLSATPLLAPGALLFVPAALLGSWILPLIQRLRRDGADEAGAQPSEVR
jgi:hypothetical protein